MISRASASEVLDLFSELKRARNWTDKQRYAPFDLGPGKARLLEYIGEHDGVSQIEVAKATGTDKALAGRSLETLIERGLVRRERSNEDGRAYVLSLSPAGRKLVKQVGSVRGQVIDRIMRSLDNRDLQDFKRIASKVLVTMKDVSPH
jgi:DNA-binding MarR family transcriptional regulator